MPAWTAVRRSIGDDIINDHVADILAVIEDDINQAIDNRHVSSRTEIPTTFSIPTMTNAKAQMYIYFHVLNTLKKVQYYPTIAFEGKKSETQKVFINVKWHSKEDEEAEAYMNKFIQMHSNDNPIEIKQKPRRRRRPAAS
jgi:hypothetical protein